MNRSHSGKRGTGVIKPRVSIATTTFQSEKGKYADESIKRKGCLLLITNSCRGSRLKKNQPSMFKIKKHKFTTVCKVTFNPFMVDRQQFFHKIIRPCVTYQCCKHQR